MRPLPQSRGSTSKQCRRRIAAASGLEGGTLHETKNPSHAAPCGAGDWAAAASAAKDVASAVSDKKLKDIDKNSSTEDIIEKAYKGLDSIIYRYNQKGQALGEDDKLRAGVTAQSLQGSILESNVFTDPESGYLKVDTAQQTLANAAAIKILFEKIDELEKLIKK